MHMVMPRTCKQPPTHNHQRTCTHAHSWTHTCTSREHAQRAWCKVWGSARVVMKCQENENGGCHTWRTTGATLFQLSLTSQVSWTTINKNKNHTLLSLWTAKGQNGDKKENTTLSIRLEGQRWMTEIIGPWNKWKPAGKKNRKYYRSSGWMCVRLCTCVDVCACICECACMCMIELVCMFVHLCEWVHMCACASVCMCGVCTYSQASSHSWERQR